MICKPCWDCLNSQEREGRAVLDQAGTLWIEHHASAASLETSAKLACQICRHVWAAFQKSDHGEALEAQGIRQGRARQFITRISISLLYLDHRTFCLGVWVLQDGQEPLSPEILSSLPSMSVYNMYFYLREHQSLLASTGAICDRNSNAPNTQAPLRSSHIENTTGSDRAFQQIMHWLEACSKSHPDCCSSTMAGEPPWYPTRLLDVGEHGQRTGGGEKIRLVTTASERPRGGYTTLSHCWGTSQPLRLLTGTMASFQQSINLAALPQTFRDAIEVTRRIGIRYLWIDSLCIIQDDDGNTDWLREAAMMHKVYSRSFCTISATASQDCNDGIFRTRTAPVVPEDPVELCVNGLSSHAPHGGEQQVPFDTQHITCDVAESQFWDDNVSNAHINTRGWVFQERLLSPRTIHFGEQQVFWECRGLDAAESFPAGWPRDPSYQFKDRLPNELDAARQHRGPEWEVFWYSRWGHVVYEYSRTDLTVPSDKLVALGGVANTFAAANGDQYVAGMWRRHLAVEILWLASRDRSGAQVAVRPPQYRAPSWSWASIDGEVMTLPFELGQDAFQGTVVEVVDVQITCADADNVTGPVLAAHLDLRGCLRRCRLGTDPSGLALYSLEVNNVHVTDWANLDEAWTDAELRGKSDSLVLYYMVAQLHNQEGAMTDTLGSNCAAPLAVSFSSHQDFRCVLLFLELLSSVQGVYKRIGASSTRLPGHVVELLVKDQDGSAQFPCRELVDGLHTVRIV